MKKTNKMLIALGVGVGVGVGFGIWKYAKKNTSKGWNADGEEEDENGERVLGEEQQEESQEGAYQEDQGYQEQSQGYEQQSESQGSEQAYEQPARPSRPVAQPASRMKGKAKRQMVKQAGAGLKGKAKRQAKRGARKANRRSFDGIDEELSFDAQIDC